MAGRPGRNRAWNKLPVEEHVKRGTYRADRHGPIPHTSKWADVLPHDRPSTPEAPPPWAPAPADVAALGEDGRQFLTVVLEQNDVDFAQGVLLLEIARTRDELTVWQTQAQTDPKAARLTISYRKTLAALMAQVNIW
jgi:hypothetical protein